MSALSDARLIVAKVGSALVVSAETGLVDKRWLSAFATSPPGDFRVASEAPQRLLHH